MPMATRIVSCFSRMVTYLECLPPRKSYDALICGLARSRDKLNPLYLYNHNTYGHQTWQGNDIKSHNF